MAQARTASGVGANIFDASKPMWQIMLPFLVPLMASNILQTVSQTFGNVYVGRLLGVNALAASSAVFPVIFFLFAFLIGIASGSTVLIGQAYGAGDAHKVKKIAGTVLGATFALGILTAIVGAAFSPAMLAFLQTPPEVLHQADLYARVLFLGSPILFPYLAYTTFLRGTGDSQTPFYVLIVSTVLTVLLTPGFILGWFHLPALGVEGSAISQVVAQGISFLALLGWLRYKRNPLKLDMETARDMLVDWKILWSVVRIGVPTGMQVVMVSLAEIAVISFVNRFGPSATAAYGAVNQVVNYVQFPAISIGISASIFGAQSIGARREDLLGTVVRSAVTLNYIIGGLLIALCYLSSWVILGWFITDPHTLDIAHGLLMITLWSYLLFGNSAVLSGVMRSSGTVLWPTLIGIIAIWAVEVPSAYVLMHHFGLRGVWMGYPLAYMAMLILQFCYYELVWKKKTHERLV